MAYKQKPGRGKCTPFKAVEKYTSSPLMNGEGEDEKTKVRSKRKKDLPQSDVGESGFDKELFKSPEGTRVVVKNGEIYASHKPKDPKTKKRNLSLRITPNDPKPKTKVESKQGAPYGFNLSNRKLKKEMKKYDVKWKGRGEALKTLSSIYKPNEKLGTQDQITKTGTTIDPFKFK
jgi:hypothetical protein